MPFIVFNAVAGIMFFLALNFIMKFYSMCWERNIDRAHVITWSLFKSWFERLQHCWPVGALGSSELLSARAEEKLFMQTLDAGPVLCSGSGKRLLC